MTRTKQITTGLLAGAALLAFGASPLLADHFLELSRWHTSFGVSQLNYADTGREQSSSNLGTDKKIYLYNPNHVTQIAAVLMYERSELDFNSNCCSAGAECQKRHTVPTRATRSAPVGPPGRLYSVAPCPALWYSGRRYQHSAS